MIWSTILKKYFIAALFNVLPIISWINAWRADDQFNRIGHQNSAIIYRLLEVVLEAFPQAALQLYILAKSNQLDIILCISVASSICSVIWGTLNGVWKGIAVPWNKAGRVVLKPTPYWTLPDVTRTYQLIIRPYHY